MDNNVYYNAKPSTITNLGADLSGAHRMRFDTYETTEEREAKARQKAIDNGLKEIKESFRSEIEKEQPDPVVITALLYKQFQVKYSLDAQSDNIRAAIYERRAASNTRETASEFNKMIRAYNALLRDLRDVKHPRYFAYYVKKMRNKFSPKTSFTEQTGGSSPWSKFSAPDLDVGLAVEHVKTATRAVQFGNSVTDKERGYILVQLSEFIRDWQANEMINRVDLSSIGWSFGARGKAGSVAYYEPTTKIISVNRNNIGSIVHEIGHHIDYSRGRISNRISYETVAAYRAGIESGLDRRSLSYYCKREEIFARAFEAYCYKHYMGFSPFAQYNKAYLPDLNDELIGLIEEALRA